MRFWPKHADTSEQAVYLRNIANSYWDKDIPDWVDGLPSMTHRREKAMYYHLTKDFPSEINRIVDDVLP